MNAEIEEKAGLIRDVLQRERHMRVQVFKYKPKLQASKVKEIDDALEALEFIVSRA